MGQLRLGLSKFRSLDLMVLCCAAHMRHILIQIGCHSSCQQTSSKDKVLQGGGLSSALTRDQLRNRRTPEAPSFLDLSQSFIIDVSPDQVQVTPKDGCIVPIADACWLSFPVGHEFPLGALSPIRVAHKPTA